VQVSCHGVTSDEVPLCRTELCRSARTPRSDPRSKKKTCFVRSARTRRSFRRRRQGLSRAGVEGVQYGVDGNLHLVQCRVGSVKHTASPSHRDWSRRVIVSLVIQLRSAASEHRDVQAATRCVPQSALVNLLADSAFPAAAAGQCLFPLFEARETLRVRPEKLRHRTAVLILL
jgi:hypothetical protein